MEDKTTSKNKNNKKSKKQDKKDKKVVRKGVLE